eukprot:182505_1
MSNGKVVSLDLGDSNKWPRLNPENHEMTDTSNPKKYEPIDMELDSSKHGLPLLFKQNFSVAGGTSPTVPSKRTHSACNNGDVFSPDPKKQKSRERTPSDSAKPELEGALDFSCFNQNSASEGKSWSTLVSGEAPDCLKEDQLACEMKQPSPKLVPINEMLHTPFSSPPRPHSKSTPSQSDDVASEPNHAATTELNQATTATEASSPISCTDRSVATSDNTTVATSCDLPLTSSELDSDGDAEMKEDKALKTKQPTPRPLGYDARIAQRMKQINLGKSTPEYERYVEHVPKNKRKQSYPVTPDARKFMSKRQWDGKVRQWRRQLHRFDEDWDNMQAREEQFAFGGGRGRRNFNACGGRTRAKSAMHPGRSSKPRACKANGKHKGNAPRPRTVSIADRRLNHHRVVLSRPEIIDDAVLHRPEIIDHYQADDEAISDRVSSSAASDETVFEIRL